MAYRFKLDDLGVKGFRRIAREQLQRAVTELGQTEIAAAGVHETRKAVKRLKSLLRLVRPALSEKNFRARYRQISKIGDALAHARDRHVMIETIGKIETRYGPESIGTLQPLRPMLAGSRDAASARSDPIAIRRALAMSIIESQKFEKISFKSKGFEVISAGLEQTYRHARRNLARAYKRPSDEAFHELRKTVQWHWRQLALISRAWPEYFEVRIAAARKLAELLGDDHDLAVLEAEVRKLSAHLPANASPIENLIIQRKEELRTEAKPYAERLFAERPNEFVRRISVYWESARHLRAVDRDKEDDGEAPKKADATMASGAAAGPRGEITQPSSVAPQRQIR